MEVVARWRWRRDEARTMRDAFAEFVNNVKQGGFGIRKAMLLGLGDVDALLVA